MSGLQPRGDMPCPTHLLKPGEQALWWGKPDRWLYTTKGWAGDLWPSLMMIGSLYFYIEINSVMPILSGDLLGSLFLINIVIIGNFIIGIFFICRPVRRFLNSKNIKYVLTEKRAIIRKGDRTESIIISGMQLVAIEPRSEIADDVLFRKNTKRFLGDMASEYDGFIGITDGKAVAREMHRLRSLYP